LKRKGPGLLTLCTIFILENIQKKGNDKEKSPGRSEKKMLKDWRTKRVPVQIHDFVSGMKEGGTKGDQRWNEV